MQISGAIEVEAGYESIDYKDSAEEDEKSSDVDLAWAELGFDAKVTKRVDGRLLIAWEEDELFVDEGFITIVGEEIPIYGIFGRQYIPFGNFDSFFVTDPTTLVLGETNEGTALGGYRFGEGLFDIMLGVYNGKVQEAGDDDQIDNLVASLFVSPLEGLSLGASYSSSIASSDTLSEFVTDPENLDKQVAGYSAFVTWTLFDRLTLVGEYLTAASEFQAGELYDTADTEKHQPAAWNAELAFAINEDWEIAARYGGSKDGGDMLRESEYGAVVNWGLWEANLALEYIHGTYKDDVMTDDTITLQLAMSF